MLKNVAIPLMLAASEAEAQRAPTKDEVRDALEGDLAEQFAGLQADAAACTVASSTATDNIANLAQTLTEKIATHEAAVNAVNALVDGAWGDANTARKAAVEAAVAKEAEDGIAGLLDDLDTASEDERAKAALYVVAEKNYAEGLRVQTAADARNDVAVAELARLEGLKTAAADAVQAAKDQHAKEVLWRSWRYCELGAAVTGATLTDPSKSWWQMVQSTYTPGMPATCVVPAVANADGTGNVREAVTYHTATTTETEDGTVQENATVKLTAATTAEAATSTVQGHSRAKAGEVAWYAGNLREKQWTEMARKRQQTYWGSINTARASAKAVASSMATTDGWDQPGTLAAPFANNEANTSLMTASAAGAKKAMIAAATARDSASTGSGKHMPAARTQSTNAGEEWKMTWGITTASMGSWKTNNSSAGAVSLWWAQARALTDKVSDWHTKWTSDVLELTTGHASFAIAEQQTTGSQSANCNESTGTWVTAHSVNSSANGDADADACKAACQAAARTALLTDPDTTSPTVDNGGLTMAKWDATSTAWCGGYSYTNGSSANGKCKFMTGADDAVVNAADTQANAADFCARMTTVKAFADAQGAVATAAANVTGTLLTNLKGAADAQAALEKAWLEAWYVQQYWANLLIQLTESGSTVDTDYGAKSKIYYDYVTTVGGSGTADNTTVVGAEAATSTAQTSLNNAQEALATLQAATAAAQAVVDGLGTRIIRADAQINELDTLANSGATGTLDAAAALRNADWTAYGSTTSGDEGEATLALNAKTAADAAVRARTSASATDGGALTEAKALALAAWEQAQQDAETAGTALTNALAGSVLATLRQTVEDDTTAWTSQDNSLKDLVQAAEDAEEAMHEAEEARDAAVLACQIAAYDDYRTALEEAMVQRAADLKAIKALLETELVEPKRGTAGARCEKALSNGTYRPKREEETVCEEGLCCGAARVWMEVGTAADAGWRTVETCQLATDTTYLYQPPRAPMATTMPQKVTVDFVCIEGAKKLAAAASAVAAAVYMLA